MFVCVCVQIALLDSPTALSMEEKLHQNEARVSPEKTNSEVPSEASLSKIIKHDSISMSFDLPSVFAGFGADQRMDQQVE